MSPQTTPPSPHLRRTLGFWEVTASGVGIIIGAGIYVLLGAATERAGSAVWLSFMLAAALSALTGLSYAELTSMFPRASAEYEYTRQAFPSSIAFVVGWSMIAGLVVASAAVALGFASYLGVILPVHPRATAILLLLAVTATALAGVKQSIRVTVALSLVQIGGLFLVIGIGIPHLGGRDLLSASNGFGGVLDAAALIFFAFIGFDEVNTLAEETRDPTRTIPRALLASLGISTILYVAVAIAAVSVLGAGSLGASPRPLADVIAHELGDSAVLIVTGIALISTANTTILALTASSRLIYGMASQGEFPGFLARVSFRQRVPAAAILVAAVLSIGFVFIDDLTLIASITNFSIYLVFLAVNATVIVLRIRWPRLPRRVRIPGAIGRVPIIPVLGLASVVVMLSRLDFRTIQIGGGICAVALFAAFLRYRFGTRPGYQRLEAIIRREDG